MQTNNSNLLCASPRIIINPAFFEHLRKDNLSSLWQDHVIKMTSSFRRYDPDAYKRVYSPKKWAVTSETLDKIEYVTKDGEVNPLYMLVPCGKCLLCRNHRSMEWQCRALVETSTSTNIPLFVTLTYAEEPVDGVNKRDLQLFMKRLRKNLSEREQNLNLRYFAVAEYGSHTHRPHYQ